MTKSDKLAKRPKVELSFEEADVVLRRALEIQQRDEGKHSISLLEVQEMAAELGVSAETVRIAYNEIRSQALVPTRSRGALDLLIGDSRVTVSRTLVGQVPDEVQRRIREYLEGQLFRLKRNLGRRTVWQPAAGLGNTIRRAMDISAQIELPTSMELEVVVAETEAATEVVLAADFRGAQGETAVATGIGTTVLVGGSVLLGVLFSPIAFGVGAALGAGTIALGRGTFAADRRKASDALERLLDEMEHGSGAAQSPEAKL